MSEAPGYENDKCHFKFPGCSKVEAGYQRRQTYAGVGPWFDACENCARVEYEQPKQFQKETGEKV